MLDIGCGTGYWLDSMHELNYQAFGIDISKIALAYCKKRALCRIAQADASRLPFVDNTFDLVTCIDVLYHQSISHDQSALSEIFRILKPGGLAVIHVPALEALRARHDVRVKTRERYTITQLVKSVEQCGFQPCRLTYRNTLTLPLLYFLRCLERCSKTENSDGSDIASSMNILSPLLSGMMRLENWLIKYLNFPIGSSIICILKKPI